MTRLEFLKEVRDKFSEEMSNNRLNAEQMQTYLDICDEIAFLDGLFDILYNLPETMNPRKRDSFVEVIKGFIKRNLPKEKAEKLSSALETFYKDFVPDKVCSFKNSMLPFAEVAIKLYNE